MLRTTCAPGSWQEVPTPPTHVAADVSERLPIRDRGADASFNDDECILEGEPEQVGAPGSTSHARFERRAAMVQ
jgi:hypothetical protein